MGVGKLEGNVLDWSAAVRYLRRVDPVLKKVIDRVGPCALSPRRDYFVVLCKSIFSQQVSTTVASIIFGRFRDLFPGRRPTPENVLLAMKQRPDAVMACGLSRQKRVYIEDLSRHFFDKRIPTRRLNSMGDEQIIQLLTEVKGIGRWTAEMFLMFVLNRPDVLPVDDLGLREGVRSVYNLPERPTPKQVIEMGEKWRPWRTVATWYIWRRDSNTL